MAFLDDIAAIERQCRKARNITIAAARTSVLLNEVDEEGETNVNLTPAQRAAILALRAACITQIKTLAAGLPGS